jgi:hypothetical protein
MTSRWSPADSRSRALRTNERDLVFVGLHAGHQELDRGDRPMVGRLSYDDRVRPRDVVSPGA